MMFFRFFTFTNAEIMGGAKKKGRSSVKSRWSDEMFDGVNGDLDMSMYIQGLMTVGCGYENQGYVV